MTDERFRIIGDGWFVNLKAEDGTLKEVNLSNKYVLRKKKNEITKAEKDLIKHGEEIEEDIMNKIKNKSNEDGNKL